MRISASMLVSQYTKHAQEYNGEKDIKQEGRIMFLQGRGGKNMKLLFKRDIQRGRSTKDFTFYFYPVLGYYNSFELRGRLAVNIIRFRERFTVMSISAANLR